MARVWIFAVVFLGGWFSTTVLQSEDARPAAAESPSGTDLQAKLKSAAKRLDAEQTYELRYKFEPGEFVRWRAVQLVTVDTKIRGTGQTAKTRSVSLKSWRVSDVDDAGNATFVYQVDEVDMWQAVSGQREVKYNSRTDDNPPREYAHVADSVAVPLARITLSPTGRMVRRENKHRQFSPNTTELAIPLPDEPVRVGAKWHVTDESRVRLEDGRVQRVQMKHVFTLEKVVAGLATIRMHTEVLSPVNDPKVEAQLVQKLQNGQIMFDLDAGRMLSKQIDLDSTVIGFSGADSVMQYLARFTEELSRKPKVSERAAK